MATGDFGQVRAALAGHRGDRGKGDAAPGGEAAPLRLDLSRLVFRAARRPVVRKAQSGISKFIVEGLKNVQPVFVGRIRVDEAKKLLRLIQSALPVGKPRARIETKPAGLKIANVIDLAKIALRLWLRSPYASGVRQQVIRPSEEITRRRLGNFRQVFASNIQRRAIRPSIVTTRRMTPERDALLAIGHDLDLGHHAISYRVFRSLHLAEWHFRPQEQANLWGLANSAERTWPSAHRFRFNFSRESGVYHVYVHHREARRVQANIRRGRAEILTNRVRRYREILPTFASWPLLSPRDGQGRETSRH